MKRKILALSLALVMCLTLLPLTASASTMKLTLDKANYQSQERITMTFTGVTAEMMAKGARLEVVCLSGGPGGQWGSYNLKNEGTFTDTLWAEKNPGTYEIRIASYQAWLKDRDEIWATATYTVK